MKYQEPCDWECATTSLGSGILEWKNKTVGLEQSPQSYARGKGPWKILWQILCARECDRPCFFRMAPDLRFSVWSVATQKYSKSFISSCRVPGALPGTHPVYFQLEYAMLILGTQMSTMLWFYFKQVSLHLLDCPCFLWFMITSPPTASFCTLTIQIQPSPALISLRPNKPELHSCDFINVSSKSDSETFY